MLPLDRISFRCPPDLGRLLRGRAKALRVPVSAIVCQAVADYFQVEALLAKTQPQGVDLADLAARIAHQGEAVADPGAIEKALLERIEADAPPPPSEAQQRVEQKRLDRLKQMGLGGGSGVKS